MGTQAHHIRTVFPLRRWDRWSCVDFLDDLWGTNIEGEDEDDEKEKNESDMNDGAANICLSSLGDWELIHAVQLGLIGLTVHQFIY